MKSNEAVKALGARQEGSSGDGKLFDSHGQVKRWLLDQQYRERHPFTDAAPGGWAWTDLSGGVPDAATLQQVIALLREEPRLRWCGLMGYDAHTEKIPDLAGSRERARAHVLHTYREHLTALREDILNALSSPEAAWYPIL